MLEELIKLLDNERMSEKLYEEVWKYALNEIKEEYKSQNREGEFTFNFNINYVEDDGANTITVSVASHFMEQQVKRKGSLEIIQEKIRQLTDLNNIVLNCIVKSESISEESKSEIESSKTSINIEESESISEVDEELSSPKLTNVQHPELKPEFTFDTFIPGENSIFAYNSALSVAKNPGKERNPVLFYGSSGLGKTHLMQAIGNYIYQQNPKLKIKYIFAENFTNEFTNSIKTKKTDDFKNKYRNYDVLLLDDIHFLSKKEQTQEELFYTFEALDNKKSQMIFTCDRPIKEIKDMADRLVTRLSRGLCIDLQPPNFETRCAILQKKVELEGKVISNDIIEYIAKNIETNVRELEHALSQIISYSELVDKKLTLDVVKDLLRDMIAVNSAENISLDIIEKVIADAYQISVYELKGKKREVKYSFPRQIAIYIAREITEISYTELGREFGKDHTTIMHANNKIAEKRKLDSALDAKIQSLIRAIREYKK